MGLLLIILGLLLWLLADWFTAGLILIILGLILLFVPWNGAYGYHSWRNRHSPP